MADGEDKAELNAGGGGHICTAGFTAHSPGAHTLFQHLYKCHFGNVMCPITTVGGGGS
jgi:hypothetical protein